MKIGIPKESARGEKRVALVPETVKKLAARQIAVLVEAGAGERARFGDAEYAAAGAEIVPDLAALAAAADAVVKIDPPSEAELALLRPGTTVVSLAYPLVRAAFVAAANQRRLTTIALDMIPRTTLAQAMDVLSSQANLAGYWAVVAAASRLPRIFPMMMTAAGTISPSRVLIMGVGVAGLSAIGTAKRLGAVVEATDVRPETKEQVESLGGRFLQVQGVAVQQTTTGYAAEQSAEYQQKQAELISGAIARADVVITTALIPGRPAPRLVSEAQVRSMKPGSVIVDLAAEQGGNAFGSVAGEEVEVAGVTIVGDLSTASNVAFHASQAFSRNMEKLLLHLTVDGQWKPPGDDPIARGCLITRDGATVHPAVLAAQGA
jgi:NAD(P) transhydrogenase subunit alpha